MQELRPPRATAALLAMVLALGTAGAETYSLAFTSSSGRMSWSPKFPSWSYTTPVAFSAAGDSTSMLRLTASASLRANMTTRDGRNNWQENGSVNSRVSYPILGKKASISINTRMSSSSRTLVKQKIRNRTIGFGFQYNPLILSKGAFKNLRVSLTPGLITARRASRANLDSTIEERGLQYNASMRVSPNWDVGEEKLTTSFSLTKRDNTLENNKNRSESIRLSLGYTLPKEVRASFSAGENRSQNGVTRAVILEEVVDDFVMRDTTVQAERSERRGRSVSTSLATEIAGFDLSARQSWSESKNTNTANADDDPRNRFFARDRQSESWDFSGQLSGELPGNLVVNSSLAYDTSDERRLPVRLAGGGSFRDPTDDRDDRNLFVRGAVDWQVVEDHRLTLSASSRAIRTDNPGDPEQDRETFSQNASLRYNGKYASGMGLGAELRSSLTHRINLDALRSSQNQRTRELRFSVNTNYERLETKLDHGFEISARRTIFDFDRQVNRNAIDRRSTIRRGWSMRHGLNRTLLDNLSLRLGYTYRADDTGILLVESAAQIVEEDNADHSLSASTSYKPFRALSFTTGFSYRLDRQWKYTYTSQGGQRDLGRRSPHRNINVGATFNPGETRMVGRFSRSRQASGTFDSVSVSISRRV